MCKRALQFRIFAWNILSSQFPQMLFIISCFFFAFASTIFRRNCRPKNKFLLHIWTPISSIRLQFDYLCAVENRGEICSLTRYVLIWIRDYKSKGVLYFEIFLSPLIYLEFNKRKFKIQFITLKILKFPKRECWILSRSILMECVECNNSNNDFNINFT